MANSQSFRRGQVPIRCNLCETEKKISWKCQDCDLLMCNGCKERIHIKIRNARNHKVTDIKHAGMPNEEFDFNNIQCKEHGGHVCVMFCNSCEKLVCTQCIAEFHIGHGLIEMSKGCQIQIQKLRASVDTIEKEETKVEDIEKAGNEKFANVKKQILNHKRNLYKDVDHYTDELLKEVDEKWNTFKTSIGEVASKANALKRSAAFQRQHIEELVNSNDAKNIFEECEKLDESLHEVSKSLTTESTPLFVPGEISSFNVGLLQSPSTDITLQVMNEYTTEVSEVFLMSACRDSLWISNSYIAQKIQPELNKTISSFDMNIIDIAVTPTDDLLFIESGESVIKQISSKTNNITDTNYTVDPLGFSTIHVTRDYKIIVGIVDFGNQFPVKGRRAVIMMNNEGTKKTVYEYDHNKQRMFSYIHKITTTSNGNICVIDQTSESDKRIIVLDQDGEILNIFTGHPAVTIKNQPFKPIFLASTPSDNIIATDLNTGVLFILSDTGRYKAHVESTDFGIRSAYSIAFTETTKMYIGCTRTKGSTGNAKLYEVKLSWC